MGMSHQKYNEVICYYPVYQMPIVIFEAKGIAGVFLTEFRIDARSQCFNASMLR